MTSLLLAVLLAAPPVSDLHAAYRQGQTFLTWREAPVAAGVRFDVLVSDQPITRPDGPGVTVAARHLLPGSACDWWLNPETYGNPLAVDKATGQKPPIPHQGWRLTEGGPRLDPDSGLLVHTVTAATAGARYFAVVNPADPVLVAGSNSLATPVTQQVAPPAPIWQGESRDKPATGAGKGLPLDLQIHAKTGRGGMEWLQFGDARLGWRDGLPFKFGAAVRGGAVQVTPTDRTWIDRMFPEGKDGCQKLTPAIHSFWYGYNDHIDDPAAMKTGTVVNFTERRLLWIVDWVKAYYATDPQRAYCTGSSMGGCGTISFGLRHPEIFAACAAFVPIVAYDRGAGGDSTVRIAAECGGMDAKTADGETVKDHLDGTRFVKQFEGDLPVLMIVNGRQDGSIPWWKCPDFYRALRDTHQPFVAVWNEGDHATASGLMPPDQHQRFGLGWLHRFRLDQSYLAFSRSSLDDDPGNGEKKNGTLVGHLNRGFEHDAPQETAERYEVVIRWYLEAAKLPVTVDVTPRRVQAFKVRPGAKVIAENREVAGGQVVQTIELTADAHGLVTVPGFKLTSPQGNRLTLRR